MARGTCNQLTPCTKSIRQGYRSNGAAQPHPTWWVDAPHRGTRTFWGCGGVARATRHVARATCFDGILYSGRTVGARATKIGEWVDDDEGYKTYKACFTCVARAVVPALVFTGILRFPIFVMARARATKFGGWIGVHEGYPRQCSKPGSHVPRGTCTCHVS